MYHSIKIQDLSLQIKLGVTATERARPQEVRVSIELRFVQAPVGQHSDLLDDTICYERIIQVLKSHIADKEFQLIEKLAGDCYRIVQDVTHAQASVMVAVHKVSPPIPGLIGGVEYRIGDFS